MQGETGDDARRWRGGVPFMESQLVELHTHNEPCATTVGAVTLVALVAVS
jgi:hypothetical protein